jgi:hypothetical protein
MIETNTYILQIHAESDKNTANWFHPYFTQLSDIDLILHGSCNYTRFNSDR